MAHSHDDNNIKVAFFLNFAFTIIEIIGGLLTNSISILSDALHDLGDSISLAVAWFLQRYSKKAPDEKFTFGYSRFSLLGALLNSIILITGSAIILVHAIPRILNPQNINAKGMLVFAIVGIVANGLAVIRLKKGKSYNEKVVLIHLLEDVLGWVAVLIVSIIMMFAYLPILDPILSVAITIFVLYNVWKNIREVMRIFLQAVPQSTSVVDVEKEIMKLENVLFVYHTHIWSMEGKRHFLTTHVGVSDSIERKGVIKLKKDIRNIMKEKDIEHITIEIDYECEEKKEENCNI